MRAAEDLWSVWCAGNSGEGWLCCVVTINASCTCYKLSSLKQTYAFSTSLRVKRLQFHHFASHSCLSPQGPGQKTRSHSILAERNSLINDECQMPMWLSISHYQMRLRRVSYRAGTNPKAVQQVGVCVCVYVSVHICVRDWQRERMCVVIPHSCSHICISWACCFILH